MASTKGFALVLGFALAGPATAMAAETTAEHVALCGSLVTSPPIAVYHGNWAKRGVRLSHTLMVLEEGDGKVRAVYATGEAVRWGLTRPDCRLIAGRVTDKGYYFQDPDDGTVVEYTKDGDVLEGAFTRNGSTTNGRFGLEPPGAYGGGSQ